MTIGEKLRTARLEAGLSQRQLCADMITRNMLSQIENGSARPSMDTLIFLAQQLNRPVSYFLEEESTVSGNAPCMEQARRAYREGRLEEAEKMLSDYRSPDPLFDDEYGLLNILLLLCKAEKALDRPIYARQLLQEITLQKTCYMTPELEYRRQLLLAQVSSEPIELPADDRPLLIRARNALNKADGAQCVVLLEACEEKSNPDWRYLRAEAAFLMEDYALAAEYYPETCFAQLEACYRNLGDYKKAYEYACKQR